MMVPRLLALSALCTVATAVCFCNGHPDVTPCNDIEARDECMSANAELADMVNSVGYNADLFLTIAYRKNHVTSTQASRLRSHLSFALEHGKPVGDCSGGLSTDTRVKNTASHCFSPTILEQCKNVKERLQTYSNGIHEMLHYSISTASDGSSLNIHAGNPVVVDYISAIRHRTSVPTANIRCASYNETTKEIEAGSTLVYSLLPFALLFAALL